MAWIAEDARARGCGLVVHSGDVFERARTTEPERRSVYQYVQRFSSFADVVVIPGNHDSEREIELIGKLEPQHEQRQIIAAIEPGWYALPRAEIFCLPWPQKGGLVSAQLSDEDPSLSSSAVLVDVLRGYGLQRPTQSGSLPRIFVGHAQIRGCRASNSQPPMVGHDFELGLEDLLLIPASYYALGHIHLSEGNTWTIGGAPVVYPGSPRRCNWGEIEQKGYVVATFSQGRCVDWERVPTPCRRMVHVECVFDGESLQMLTPDPDPCRDAEIRLRYTTAKDQRAAAKLAALALRDRFISAGAALVKDEEVVLTQTRARAPEVVQAATVREKLEAHWQSIGFDPGERRSSLFQKLQLAERAIGV